MRPPYGNTNRRIDHVAQKLDLAEIYWNVDTLDWKHPDTDRLITYTLRHAGGDKVILMHDVYPTTAAAVPKIITGLQARDYTLVTVSGGALPAAPPRRPLPRLPRPRRPRPPPGLSPRPPTVTCLR